MQYPNIEKFIDKAIELQGRCDITRKNAICDITDNGYSIEQLEAVDEWLGGLDEVSLENFCADEGWYGSKVYRLVATTANNVYDFVIGA